ncbi:hypothetical protein M406DRAFT_355993 [Cryphonectria parasitica EP155]|uniref:Uncharacterized protein n=1 Tax=Cryphonectria parasitica (strain ATCC 38755 / EP155) TaxID=660469 RepID=A0A9P5CNY9_CRYP1|nr:uncharacterized protein M406DRAFT_355993 [Cryphonectria parasitica EP155]KAF3765618.1 hypothetical protein M406DRAFT_355993 [Cryphonectria parasitica EP155]
MNRYVPALFSLSAKLGINVTVVYLGEAHASLFTGKAGGEGDRWDITGIIRYEKFGDFRKLTEHEDYVKEALPHRLASLEEARLVVTTELWWYYGILWRQVFSRHNYRRKTDESFDVQMK